MEKKTRGVIIIVLLTCFVCGLSFWSHSLQQKILDNDLEISSRKPIIEKNGSPKVPNRIEKVALDKNEKIISVIVEDTITGKVFERKN